MDPTTSSGAALPAELAPKRGRPPGAKNRVPEGPAITKEALAAAWHGLWLVCKVLTWALGGRASAPLARWTRELYSLDDLPDEEALDDARSLLPLFRDFAALARALTFVGAPVLLARRVAQHLRRTPVPRPEPKDVGRGSTAEATAPR